MTIAAMKQALECLESLAAEPPGVRALHLDAVVIQNLRAAIEQAEKAEPVAWRWTWKTSRDQDGYCYTHTYPSKPKLMNIEALYTHPAPVPAGWQQLFEQAIFHLKAHAAEYSHPGQPQLIADMEALVTAQKVKPHE